MEQAQATTTQKLTLRQLLRVAIERDASDLHVTTDSPPHLRIDGGLVPLRTAPLTPEDTRRLCYEVMTEQQQKRFENQHELDFSFGVDIGNAGRLTFRTLANHYLTQESQSSDLTEVIDEAEKFRATLFRGRGFVPRYDRAPTRGRRWRPGR